MSLALGTSLKDRYQIQEELGRGGMAVVYRARDAILQRDVAVKILHAHLADRKVARQRLRREAVAVAKLSQDHILKVYDFSGEDENGPAFLVTEYVRGTTLRALLDEHKDLPCEVGAMIGVVLAEALAHAHKEGIVHRDIKPENVMYRTEDGALKLMDFGIAKLFEEKELTMTGGLLGSPAHMAPEVIEGKTADARSDLFSLGTMVYLFATGDYPFWAQNPHALLRQIAQGKFKDPEVVRPAVGKKLSSIIKRSMALDPQNRFPDAESFAQELKAFLLELGIDQPQKELGAILKDPEGEGQRLKERVIEALLVRAREALRLGKKGEVLRHLNRVMGYDPENAQAKEIETALNKSNRWIYAAAALGAVVGVAGLVGGGVWLYSALFNKEAEVIDVVPFSLPWSGPLATTEPTSGEFSEPDTFPIEPVSFPVAVSQPVTNPVGPKPASIAVVPIPPNPKTNPTSKGTEPKPPVEPPKPEWTTPVTFTTIADAEIHITDKRTNLEKDFGGVDQNGKKTVLLTAGEYSIRFTHPEHFAETRELTVKRDPDDKASFLCGGISCLGLSKVEFDVWARAIVIVTGTPKDAELRAKEVGGEDLGPINSGISKLEFKMKSRERDAEVIFSVVKGDYKDPQNQIITLRAGNNASITLKLEEK